jgi:hypothetical protein
MSPVIEFMVTSMILGDEQLTKPVPFIIPDKLGPTAQHTDAHTPQNTNK